MAVQDEQAPVPGEELEAPPAKSLTIGAVCKALEPEFPDISISKIRYLEDQKLLAPRRTPGGYRLYSPADVDRLRKKHEGGEEVITGDDVQKLTDILAGRAAGDVQETE